MTEELTSDASGNLGTLEGIPFGTVTVKELTAPEGYRLDTEVHTYTVDGSQLTGDVYELEVDDLTEDVQRGGLTIQKLDSETGTTPQGDASLEGIVFEIVNNSQNAVVAMTITTNVAGVATTGENALPYGDYTVREVSTNDSMLKTFTEEISVTISEDGQMLEYEAENEVVRGGIDIEKQDSLMGTTPQGNSSFAGIAFEVINRSANCGNDHHHGRVRPRQHGQRRPALRHLRGTGICHQRIHVVDMGWSNGYSSAEWTFCGGHRRGRGGTWRSQRREAGHHHRQHTPGRCQL